MIDQEKPGIDPQWADTLATFNAWVNQRRAERREARLELLDDLRQFIESGSVEEDPDDSYFDDRTPPIEQWESFGVEVLSSLLINPLIMDFELTSRLDGRFDLMKASQCFDIAYPAWLCELHYWYLNPVRFIEDGNDEHLLAWDRLPEVALGVVLGRRREAETLFRLLCKATRRQEASAWIKRPLSDFMMRLMADHLGLPEIETPGFDDDLPSLTRLRQHWHDPDPETIAPLCLAVCDVHTQVYGDHAVLSGGLVPYEILMLFRLREWAGLANPVLDHPLMAPPFDRLPATSVMWSHPDPELLAAYERLKRDGFDEDAIVRMILEDEHDTETYVLENLPEMRENALRLRTFSSPELGVWIELPTANIFGWEAVPELSGDRQWVLQNKMLDCGLSVWGIGNPGNTLDQWAELRHREVIRIGLRPLNNPRNISGLNWDGVLRKYRGMPAGATREQWLWVLCIATSKRLISVDLTYTAKTMNSEYRVFEWLLRTKLGLTKDA